ncbi:PLP-dependent aminotransferase family protein [Microbacterium sp. cx-59]|uniref:MocR-like transcription factor YczR n=1 Tax=Microbacterium sp. cx-59 TaxID=2891207 RepID=UPI001E5D88A8|nr:PLP-dependent aminotransferase family protein [Microbacterium sp. cx-59]MCC4907163.1 PLP-dependent aminotransferase family protein [Microbacterium sp. cx-59]
MDSRISARALTVLLGGWRTSEPAYEALADSIRLLGLDNRIAPRTALPAERELAAALGVSRTTIAAAYRSLRESGDIRSIRGSGSVTEPLGRAAVARTVVADPRAIDLQQASPPAWPGLAGVIAEAAGSVTTLLTAPGYDVIGNEALRAVIAERYTRSGIPTDAGEIMITNGAQSALHLLATTLVVRGDRVLIESPTYPHAAESFRAAGARLVSVPVTTGDGWDLDRAEQAFERTAPTLAYLMPDFQNPTGRSMNNAERDAMERAAARAGTTVIVDETTADLDIDRAVKPRAFGMSDAGASVIRVGSFGKTVWGGLRVGWIRANADLLRRVMAARFAIELGTPEWEQLIARTLVPRLPEIIAQRAHVLREGRDALVDALHERLPEWSIPTVDGGLSLWVDLGAPLSGALVMGVRSEGVLLSAGPRFSIDGGYERNLRVPFTVAPARIDAAVNALAVTWQRIRAGAAPVMLDRLDAVV